MDWTEQLREALATLAPAQAIAIDALVAGRTHAEAAQAAGVSRETVTRWVGHHPAFRVALDRYRHALAVEQADLAARVRGQALTAVHAALLDGDLTVALAVLRAIPAIPVGSPPALEPEALVPSPPAPVLDPTEALADLLDTAKQTRQGEAAFRSAVARLARAAGVEPES